MSKNLNQIISEAIDVSVESKVPVLLLSNPGNGKTTTIKAYAKARGYEVEEIRGSQSSPEEILGYYVNEGKEYLTHKYPEWFIRVCESDKPYILFLDEITTVNEYTQAALLKLIFDRQINNRKLPDSCVIVAAGNYPSNLSSNFKLLTPLTNRFCILNLHLTQNDMLGVVDDYLTLNGDEIDIPKLGKKNKMNEEDVFQKIKVKLKTFISSNSSVLMFHKPLTEESVTSDVVYGLITPRSLNYLGKILMSGLRLGISEGTMKQMTLGLIGFGTNSFNSEMELSQFQDNIDRLVESIRSLVLGSREMSVATLVFNAVSKEPIVVKDSKGGLSYSLTSEYLEILERLCKLSMEANPPKPVTDYLGKYNVKSIVSALISSDSCPEDITKMAKANSIKPNSNIALDITDMEMSGAEEEDTAGQ
ncbi:TPA: ATP-binding protein [Campylobacter jejuni]